MQAMSEINSKLRLLSLPRGGFLDKAFFSAEDCNGVSFALGRHAENAHARWSVRFFSGEDVGVLLVFMTERPLFKGAVGRCGRRAR